MPGKSRSSSGKRLLHSRYSGGVREIDASRLKKRSRRAWEGEILAFR